MESKESKSKWEEKFDLMFHDVYYISKETQGIIIGLNNWIKSFISQELSKAREDAVREHDAKWHPIENNRLLTHQEVIDKARAEGVEEGLKSCGIAVTESYTNKIRLQRDKEIIEMIDGMMLPFNQDFGRLGNQALDTLKSKLNEKA